MTTFPTVLLVLAVLTMASICEPTPAARTPDQLADAVRRASWWQRVRWLLHVVVDPPFVVVWYAGRAVLYFLTAAVAWGAARLASWLAMDGRALRIYRTARAGVLA